MTADRYRSARWMATAAAILAASGAGAYAGNPDRLLLAIPVPDGYSSIVPTCVARDGSVVAGYVSDGSFRYPFRWTACSGVVVSTQRGMAWDVNGSLLGGYNIVGEVDEEPCEDPLLQLKNPFDWTTGAAAVNPFGGYIENNSFQLRGAHGISEPIAAQLPVPAYTVTVGSTHALGGCGQTAFGWYSYSRTTCYQPSGYEFAPDPSEVSIEPGNHFWGGLIAASGNGVAAIGWATWNWLLCGHPFDPDDPFGDTGSGVGTPGNGGVPRGPVPCWFFPFWTGSISSFLWLTEPGIPNPDREIGCLSGYGGNTLAMDISYGANSIVGGCWTASSGPVATRWSPAGTVYDMDPLGEFGRSIALKVSADGQAVGYSSLGAFLWRPSDGMHQLWDVLDAEGHDVSNWILRGATAISDDAQTITGVGKYNNSNVAFILTPDCNGNGDPDVCDISKGFSTDCNNNHIPDECEIADGTQLDCNKNGLPDVCDIASGFSEDCNSNGVPDECDPDCNNNEVVDECECVVDLAIVIDTSGSMDNAITTLCNVLPQLLDDLEDEPVDLNVTVYRLGDNEDRIPCLDDDDLITELGAAIPCTSPQLYLNVCDVNGSYTEDWGGATAVIAERHPWRLGASRLIVPISDEGPRCGDPCNGPTTGDDKDIIDVAINVCRSFCLPTNTVAKVYPVVPNYSSSCVKTLAARLGTQTYGSSLILPTSTSQWETSLFTFLRTAVANGCPGDCDFNGVPDSCEITGHDCNNNGVLDRCDIARKTSRDCDSNGVPDECQSPRPACHGGVGPGNQPLTEPPSGAEIGSMNVFDFVDGLLKKDLRSDCNGDGVVDPRDLDCFLRDAARR